MRRVLEQYRADSAVRTVPGGQVWFELVCDDLRLAGMKLIFLIVTRGVSVPGLLRRAWWKDAKIVPRRAVPLAGTYAMSQPSPG